MKKQRQALIIGIILIIIVAIVFYIIGFSNSSGMGNIVKNNQENCREIQTPYQEIEEYTEQEPYQDTEYYDYYLTLEKVLAYTQERLEPLGRGLYDEARVDLRNIDNLGEWVTVTFYWKTISKEWTNTDRQFIEPGETIRFISVYDKTAGEDTTFSYNYQSDPIQKSKVVTKYRDVTKTRAVTKYKTEKICE